MGFLHDVARDRWKVPCAWKLSKTRPSFLVSARMKDREPENEFMDHSKGRCFATSGYTA